ncbi:MAG: GNAT family N-acetyltransferase [Pseudomonadota bacterium]
MSLTVRDLAPQEVPAHLEAIAGLRIAVFRDWPYLYDGDLAYEQRYLRPYAESADALVVAAFEGQTLVGCATATPMEDHADEFAAALAGAGLAAPEVYYCAESVLLPAYRGRGLGHAFFDYREAKARALGRRWSCFCAVIRPADHPMRPADYRPLDPFWRKRGYARVEGAETRFAWRDIGAAVETEKPMSLWLKRL